MHMEHARSDENIWLMQVQEKWFAQHRKMKLRKHACSHEKM